MQGKARVLVEAVRQLARPDDSLVEAVIVSREALRLCKGLESACRGPWNAYRGRENVVESMKVPRGVRWLIEAVRV